MSLDTCFYFYSYLCIANVNLLQISYLSPSTARQGIFFLFFVCKEYNYQSI